ncbi:unnamed protein product [Urochloa decumbens]|uniref:F-box domain-containing protein n=1 Tax=Urochloa decumbens TaxID=240449 RepID=A0ABC9G2M9_9POAL
MEGDVRCAEEGATTTEDRISGLTDDLLHIILLRLYSTPEAARTSVLSRRWRRVWQTLPELSFFYNDDKSPSPRPSSETVGVDRLEIAMPRTGPRFPPAGVAPWLRFASQRLTGKLRLSMAPNHHALDKDGEAIVLPPCARATAIRLDLHGNTLRFGQASAGAFTALSTLSIEYGRMESRDLEDVVSSGCPSLKKLVLGYVFLCGASDSGLCIRSDSLEHLEIFGDTGLDDDDASRLEVDAPKLRFFSPRCSLPKARIVAPMLSEVCWYNYPYNANLHHLVDVGRHLRRLDIHTNSPAAELMKLFDTVEDLNLTLDIGKYHTFLKNIDIVPKCETLLVRFTAKEHAFLSTMRHLLKNGTSIKKLELFLFLASTVWPPCLPCCPCRLPGESVTLDSLEEVEIYFLEGSYELLHVIELLSNNAVILKKIVIRYEPSSVLRKEVREKVHRMCHPNIKVEFTVLSCRKRLSYYASSKLKSL